MLGMSTQRRRLFLALAATLLALVGCQLVAGIGSRSSDPLAPNCALPQGSGPQVRVANLAPTSDQVDVCIRVAGTSDWGRPAVNGNGTACATEGLDAGGLGAPGFSYSQVSIAFGAPGPNVDVKMIAGGNPCSVAAIAEADGVTLATNAVTTLALMGGNGVPETVVAMPEADAPVVGGQRYRLVHAAPGTGSLYFGTTAQDFLPTDVALVILSGAVPYGGTVPSGVTQTSATTPLGDNGYVTLPVGKFPFGASLNGAGDKAVFLYTATSQAATFSLYVVGVQGNDSYPLRALVCSEDAPPANSLLTACSVSTLASISVDTYNTALYGQDSPDFVPREQDIPAAIAASTADVMCLVELDYNQDQAAIIQAAQSAFPYSYTVHEPRPEHSVHGLRRPERQHPAPRPRSRPVPGSLPTSSTERSSADCLEQSCSDQGAGRRDGQARSAGVLPDVELSGVPSDSRASQCWLLRLRRRQRRVGADVREPRQLVHVRLSSAPGVQAGPRTRSFFRATSSRIPILSSCRPRSTGGRSSTRQVQLEDQSVDFYCGFLMTTENAGGPALRRQLRERSDPGPRSLHAGVGQRAALRGATAHHLGAEEEREQSRHRRRATGTRVSRAPGRPRPGTFAATALNPATMDLFGNTTSAPNWQFATPSTTSGSAWQPQCNVCPPPENPYNGATDQYFFSQPMLVNWPQAKTATIDESLLYTQGVTSLGGDAGQGPLSPYFGVNFKVIRPH